MKSVRTRLLATAAILALGGPAYAADMAVKAAPAPPVAPVNTWTGFYGGFQAGWAHLDGSCSQTNTVGFGSLGIPCATNPGTNSDSAIGGLRVGYDYQFGAVVAGIVADWNWTSLNWSQSTPPPATLEGNGHGNLLIDSLPSVRGRIGWAVDNWLVYATGGVAWARVSVNSGMSNTCCGNWAAQTNTTKTGAVAGGGIEYRVTRNVSLFAEGLWYGGFGTVNNSRFCAGTANFQFNTCFASGTYTTSFKINDIVAGVAGINFRF
jgi:outer membrane immunogenic protein